jgi:hypothetical protein
MLFVTSLVDGSVKGCRKRLRLSNGELAVSQPVLSFRFSQPTTVGSVNRTLTFFLTFGAPRGVSLTRSALSGQETSHEDSKERLACRNARECQ